MCAKAATAAFAHTHRPAISCDGERNWGLPEHKMQADSAKYEAILDLRRIVPLPTCVEDELEALQDRIDVEVGQLLGLVGFSW